ncbi:hypothetical protein M406DRAFT_220324, partial [Cryphonectria parasitica EP155]
RFIVYHGPNRQALIRDLQNVDVVITTYETLRSDCDSKGPLYNLKWFRQVLDEAHRIRNRSSQNFKAACQIRAKHKWCLTGTPIHSSLDDYGALLSFIRTPLLAEKTQFARLVAHPIKKQQHHSAQRLQDLVKATCLRRTKNTSSLSLNLPARTENVELVRLHLRDLEIYDFFKAGVARMAAGTHQENGTSDLDGWFKGKNILGMITCLRRVCDHGKHLLPVAALDAWTQKNSSLV